MCFYSFVHSITTLQEFMVKFEKVVNSQLEAERMKDYESSTNFIFLV